jgi:uncharacterized membrane protein YadS
LHRVASVLPPDRVAAVEADVTEASRAAFLSIAGFTAIGLCLALFYPAAADLGRMNQQHRVMQLDFA